MDPRKVREMTIVGSKRMIVYDDVAPLEKIRIFDARVESPPHYDTFAEFQYAYHYGDMYVPYIKQEEPLKTECQHFLDCIKTRHTSADRRQTRIGTGPDFGGLHRIVGKRRRPGRACGRAKGRPSTGGSQDFSSWSGVSGVDAPAGCQKAPVSKRTEIAD